jgi:hypothetical protein
METKYTKWPQNIPNDHKKTKWKQNIPNDRKTYYVNVSKIYLMTTKYMKQNIPNGNKIYQMEAEYTK